MADPHIHEPGDGRGARNVFVDGKLMKQVVYADTRRGIVKYYPYGLPRRRCCECLVVRTRRGRVEVKLIDG